MRPSEAIEMETARDAFRLHFRTDPARSMKRTANGHANGHVMLDMDIAHVTGLVDVDKSTPFGNGARVVYDLDYFLKACAVVRDAYPDQQLVIAFSEDEHWPCIIRASAGQYGVAVAPRSPGDMYTDEHQSGIATIAPTDLELKPREEEF